jgi:hypothetical protein
MEWRCPQYYLISPFVQSVLYLVDDYNHNRLDRSMLGVALIDYLKLASSEMAEFKTFWESELTD